MPEYAAGDVAEQPIYAAHRLLPNLVPYTAFRNMPLGFQDCVETIHYSATGQRLMAGLLLQGLLDARRNTQPGLLPEHPSGLSVAANGTTPRLSWTAPNASSSAPVTGYVVLYLRYHPRDSSPYPLCPDTDPSPPARLRTHSLDTEFVFPAGLLQADTSYQFDVSAVSDSQMSSGSFDSWLLHNTSSDAAAGTPQPARG